MGYFRLFLTFSLLLKLLCNIFTDKYLVKFFFYYLKEFISKISGIIKTTKKFETTYSYCMRGCHLLNSCQYWIRFCLHFCRVNIGKYISDVLVCRYLVISEASCLSHVHGPFYLFYELFMSIDNFSIKVLRISSWPGRNPCMWKALALCHLSCSMLFAFNFTMFLIFKHFFYF